MLFTKVPKPINLFNLIFFSTLTLCFIVFLVAIISYTRRCREINKEVEEGKPERSAHGGLHALIAFIVMAVIIVLSLSIYTHIRRNPKDFARDAKFYDISTTSDIDWLKLGTVIVITPKSDIYELKVEIDFLNSDKDKIYTLYKSLGDVKKDNEYRITIALSDVSLSVSLNATYTSISVSEGKVCYFV